MRTSPLAPARLFIAFGTAVLLATAGLFGAASAVAAPSYVTLGIGVYDWANFADLPNKTVTATLTTAPFTSATSVTGPAGEDAEFYLDPGDYNVTFAGDAEWRAGSRTVTVYPASSTHTSVSVTRHGVITGSVPAGTGGHLTVSGFLNFYPWVPLAGTTTWTGDSFRFVADEPSNVNWSPIGVTLLFTPDATIPYAPTYLNNTSTIPDSYGSTGIAQVNPAVDYAWGAVSLVGATFLSGSVDGSFGAIAGASVTATPTSGSPTYTATADSSGNYEIQLPATTQSYTVAASASGYQTASISASVSASGTGRSPGNDLTLTANPGHLIGNVVDQAGDPYAVSYHLFTYDSGTGVFGQTPQQFSSSDAFDLAGLAPGSYRIALYDGSLGEYLPFSGYTASTVVAGETESGPTAYSSARTTGDCYIEVTVAEDEGDYVFDDVAVDPDAASTACDQALWGGTFSGDVTNEASTALALSAELRSEGDPDFVIDAVAVDSNGHYELQGVGLESDYFVKIVTADLETFFDTFTGELNASITDSYDVAGVHVLEGESSSANDVTLVPATVFTGTVTTATVPLEDACVSAYDGTDYWCGSSDAAGNYYVKAPPGQDYTLEANKAGYDSEYWEDPSALGTPYLWANAAQTVNYDLDFDLAPWPPAIYGYVQTDELGGDYLTEGTLHLYRLIGTGWGEVDSYELDPLGYPGYFYFDEDDVAPAGDGLPAGDYRIRVQAADGSWLALSEFNVDDDYSYGPPDVCAVDVDGLAPGPTLFVGIAVNESSSVSCGDEPVAPAGPVTGTLVESTALGGSPVEGQRVELRNSTGGLTAFTTTDSLGAFTFAAVPAGTYSVEVPTAAHVAGEHSYAELVVDNVLIAGGASLASIVLHRYGNAYGSIDNWVWDAAADPTYVLLMRDDGAGWQQVSNLVGVIDEFGNFDAPGIDEDGYYALYFDGPDDSPFADGFMPLGQFEPIFEPPFAGVAEEDYFVGAVTLSASQFISGTAYDKAGNPISGALVTATDYFTGDEFYATTASDGSYSLKVYPFYFDLMFPIGIYDIYVEKAGYQTAYYLLAGGSCGCGGPFSGVPIFAPEAGEPPVTGVDFTLYPDGEIVFDVLSAFDDSGSLLPYPGVTTHLYKSVPGGWQEIDSDVSSSGELVPFLGLVLEGSSIVTAHADADYRLRFSEGSRWLSVDEYTDYGLSSTPVTSTACFIDFDDLELDDYIELDVVLDELTPSGECGAEPAIYVAPPSTHTVKKPAVAAPTVTPTPSATPTPTPTATEQPAVDEPERGDVSTDRSDRSEAVPFYVWLIIVIVVLGIATIVVIRLRRRI